MTPSRSRASPPGSTRPRSSRSRRKARSEGLPVSRASARRSPLDSAYRPENALAAIMLGACLVLGGGGTSNPFTEVVLELLLPLFVVVAAWWPDRHANADTRAFPRTALVITALVLVIPVAQLVPLPPAIWHGWPGRQAEVSSLALVGAADRWMPLSLTPARTFASLLATVAELAVFLAAARLDSGGRRILCMVIAGIDVVSVLLGSLQLSVAGGYSWSMYSAANFGWVLGFHSNRNAATDTLQIGVLALAAVMAGSARRQDLRPLRFITVLLVMLGLALGAVLTGSRAGIVLLPLTYFFAVWILWPVLAPALRAAIGRRAMWLVLVLPPLMCLALAQTEQVQHALSRFGDTADAQGRWDIWHDTMTAIHSVWPLGGGISSFQVVYDATQSIERMSFKVEGRAHNDWLEWVLESGIYGIAILTLIALIVLLCNLASMRLALRRGVNSDYRAQTIFATGTLLHIGLHATVDYPMRSMALAALLATAAAMLMPIRTSAAGSE